MSEQAGLWLWIRLAVRHYLFLGLVALAAGGVTLAVGFMMPRWYQARASILPPHERRSLPSGMSNLDLVLQSEFLESFSEVALADVYLGILHSHVIARSLIERFDLTRRYKQPTIVETIGVLKSHTLIVAERGGIIVVKVEDKSPETAADLANAYMEELDRVYRETRSTSGRRQRVFLESRVVEAKVEVDSAEAALAAVQSGKGIMVMRTLWRQRKARKLARVA